MRSKKRFHAPSFFLLLHFGFQEIDVNLHHSTVTQCSKILTFSSLLNVPCLCTQIHKKQFQKQFKKKKTPPGCWEICGWTVVVMNYFLNVWGGKRLVLAKRDFVQKARIKDFVQQHQRPSQVITFTFWLRVMPLKDKPIHRRSTQESQCLASTMG